jgi:UDP-N-acetylmuramyl pentapeptide phosphotransferase/UDP-N-acetylglucosamine-1-phosphate transferase
MNYYILIHLYILISTLLSFFLFLIYNKLAKKINYIDNKIPTGSGIIFYIIFFLGFFYFYYFKIFYLLPNKFEIIFLSLILFAILSFADDKINIHFAYRFISQLLLIFLSLSVIPINELQLPLKIAMLISLICWIIILNYINFIDGSDGFCATTAISIFVTLVLLNYFFKINFFSTQIAIISLPALFAFIFFNKPKAKMYMGDTGSIYLGYFLGFVFLETFIKGYWNLSISLLIYPILDCSITILKKIYNGYYPWERLFDYFFLKPIKYKKKHTLVFNANLIFNIINVTLILLQIKLQNNFIILGNIILAVLMLRYYEKNS